MLKTLAAKEGFELSCSQPGAGQGPERRCGRRSAASNPDWVISWNLSPHARGGRARDEAQRHPDGEADLVNWFNEVDINNIGAAEAKGLKRGTNVVGGNDHPLMKQILPTSMTRARATATSRLMDDIYYNTGLAMYSVMFEGVAHGHQARGLAADAGEDQGRAGKPASDFDANGLIAPVTVTAKDHGGGGKTRIDMWDGSKWVPQSDWFAAYTGLVNKLVKANSADYAKAAK